MIFRICCSPPKKECLVGKYQNYLTKLNQESGIDNEKENYPDKDYLVLLIATLSNGQDEIFNKNYYPPSSDRRKIAVPALQINNYDGLFTNVPPHLLAAKGQRSIKMVYSSLEE